MPLNQDGQQIRSSEAYDDQKDNTQAETLPTSLREDLDMLRTMLRLLIDPGGNWYDTPSLPNTVVSLIAVPFTCTAAEQVNNLVYLSSDDNVRQADGADPDKLEAIGWIVSKSDATNCLVFSGPGPVAAAGLTAPGKVYLSDTVPGGVTQVAPAFPAAVVEVGFAKNSTSYIFQKAVVQE